jgi:hypothetical protein
MEIILSLLINTISLYGAGKVALNLLKSNIKNIYEEIFYTIILGVLFSGILSILLNILIPINYYVANLYVTSTLLIGIYFLNRKILKIFFFFIILGFLLTYKSTNVVDFPLYHSPYVGIINSEKIIFGLTNIHFRFGYSSIIQNSLAIYNIAIFNNNNFQTLVPLIFLSLIFYFFEFLKDKKNYEKKFYLYILNFIFFFIIILNYYRYNSFGLDMPSHILTFFIWSKVFDLIIYKEYFKVENCRKNFELIIIVFLFTFMNKIQFLLNLLIISFYFFKNISILKKIFIRLTVLTTIITLPFFFKNFVNSGCLIYPINITCDKHISWGTKNKTYSSNPVDVYDAGEAWSKDWPNKKNNTLNYSEYSKNFKWLNTWIDNHLLVIIKKNSLQLILITFLILYLKYYKTNQSKIPINIPKLNSDKKKQILYMFFVSLILLIIWFNKFPLYRYGVSFISVCLALISIIILFYSKLEKKKFIFFLRMTILFFLIFINLNLLKIYKNFNNTDWPNLYSPKNDQSYYLYFDNNNVKIEISNDVCFYKRNICTNYKLPDKLKVFKKNQYIFIN